MTYYTVDSDKFVLIMNDRGCISINDAIHDYLKHSADKFINPKILTHHLIFIRFIEGRTPEYKILPKQGIEIDTYLREGWYVYQGSKKSMTPPNLLLDSIIRSRSSSIEFSNDSLKNSTDILVDDFNNFVLQCIKTNIGSKIDKVVLFNRYVLWCSTNRLIPESSELLDISLRRKGYIYEDGSWLGLSFQ